MFGGRCAEALEFYKYTLGAKVEMVMHFNESPDPLPPGMLAPGFEDKIMHSAFTIGETTIMASDGCDANSEFQGFSLSLSLPTEAEVDRAFKSLSEGGTVQMPLAKTFWSPRFGMLTDKFGLGWMIGISENK